MADASASATRATALTVLRRGADRATAALRARFSPGGATVAGLGAAAWLIGWRTGWEEMFVIAGGALTILAISLLWTIGSIAVEVDLEVDPTRCKIGRRPFANVTIRNPGPRRVIGLRVEVPVGKNVVPARVPALASGAAYDEPFVIPTNRRSVITVGPARSVRSDPLQLVRRELTLSGTTQLFVHPETAEPRGVAAGWTRDLEGLTTRDLSPSDLAFHTLRDYVPGDDLRHIHWRSSARHNRWLVRQYHDTRRSMMGLGLSLGAEDYASGDEFELAVSVAGSVGLAAFAASQALSAFAGNQRIASGEGLRLLDALSGVETDTGSGLGGVVRALLAAADALDVVFVVVGSGMAVDAISDVRRYFPVWLPVIALRCHDGGPPGLRRQGSFTLLNVTKLDDLVPMLSATVAV